MSSARRWRSSRPGRLLDLSGAELLPHRWRAAVHRLHVCLHRQLSVPRVAAVRFRVHASSAALGFGRAQRRDLSSISSRTTTSSTFAGAVCGGSLAVRPHHASISRSGASIARCRCCWGSCWCRCSSGSRKTSARSPAPGSIPRSCTGWSLVSFAKLGSWFLLLIISYTLVTLVNGPRERRREQHMARGLAVPRARPGASPSAAS